MKDMAAIKPIREWKHVFLDTSIIIDYLNNPAKEFKDQDYKQRILASHKILNFLLNPELLEQDKSGKVKLYVSVITLSEMIKDKSPDVSSVRSGCGIGLSRLAVGLQRYRQQIS